VYGQAGLLSLFLEAINMALTEAEAKEFQAQFKLGTFTFGAVAAVAHVLVFAWKPWWINKAAALTDAVSSLVG